MLLAHFTRLAVSRARLSEGSRIDIMQPTITMLTAPTAMPPIARPLPPTRGSRIFVNAMIPRTMPISPSPGMTIPMIASTSDAIAVGEGWGGMNKIVSGAVSGFAATAPMTAAMIVMHRMLPPTQRYPLPPRKVTMRFAKAAGVKHAMSEPQRNAATIAAHFGYGAAMGGIYSSFADKVPAPRVATGIGWGLVVWAASYLGLLP